MTNATLSPCPSTKALVARVVDRETKEIFSGSIFSCSTAFSTADAIPKDKSLRVVRAFEKETTRSSPSKITASV